MVACCVFPFCYLFASFLRSVPSLSVIGSLFTVRLALPPVRYYRLQLKYWVNLIFIYLKCSVPLRLFDDALWFQPLRLSCHSSVQYCLAMLFSCFWLLYVALKFNLLFGEWHWSMSVRIVWNATKTFLWNSRRELNAFFIRFYFPLAIQRQANCLYSWHKLTSTLTHP